jgi:hypothetical protein
MSEKEGVRICTRCRERPARKDGNLCDVCDAARLDRLARGEEWPPEPPEEM